MSSNFLLIPAGGTAERMLGLPKFLLPANKVNTLIEEHISAALAAGFDKIFVGVKSRYFSILADHVAQFSPKLVLINIERDTISMCDTLLEMIQFVDYSASTKFTVSMPDTIFLNREMQAIYSDVINDESDLSFTVFRIRNDQFGKLGQLDIVNNKVIAAEDKNPECKYPFAWGIASFKGKYFQYIDKVDAHIGITIGKLLQRGEEVYSLDSKAEYFDCGTLQEYKRFLNVALE